MAVGFVSEEPVFLLETSGEATNAFQWSVKGLHL